MSRTSRRWHAARRWRATASAHICFPTDLQALPADDGPRRHAIGPNHEGTVLARTAGLPDAAELGRAAEVLNAGHKVAILAGRGALGAGELLERLADKLAAPIVKPLLGKGVVPDDEPLHDRFHRAARNQAVRGCARRVRHPADRRVVLSLHRVLSQARPGARRADRPGRGAHRAALSGRGGTRGRQPRHARRPAAAADTAIRSRLPGEGPDGHGRLDEDHGRARITHGRADEAAGRRGPARQPPHGRRDRRLRFGHHHHLVRAPSQVTRHAAILAFRQPGHDGLRPALRHRRAGRVSRIARWSPSLAMGASAC